VDQLTSSDPTHIGPYRLVARLGAGGMGLVYLGRSEAGRTVAVKVVQAEYAQHPEFRRRFAREVAASRRVGGAWTADVLDADTDAAVPWVATQYILGPDLATVVARDHGPLPADSVRVLANRLALALRAVHGAGLIHRDLKPSNVLVTVDGPRVIDFGIARAMDGLTGDSLHTRTGMLIGSPGFMSPEQVRGRELTPASDVFCLGAVLVYAATGRLLFGADETGLNAHLFRIAEEEPDLIGVPEPLLALAAECLDKDPARRPTPEQVAARTAAATEGEWLPGAVLAQLGRHAAQLLDYAPETAAGTSGAGAGAAEAASPAADPRVPAGAGQPRVPIPPPPAHAPTVSAHAVPPPESAPPPGTVPYGSSTHPQGLPLPSPSRWWGLAVVAFMQLFVVLDSVSLSVAMPAIVADRRLSGDGVHWTYTAYYVAFGGLLLLGGRLADRVGRRRMLFVGLCGYAVAAALGELASTAATQGVFTGVLITSRVLQGGFAALLTPAALGVVSANFTEPKARGRAFGVYAALVAGGATFARLPGAWLVEALGWRSYMYVEILLAVLAMIGVATGVRDRPTHGGRRLDARGLLLGCAGTAALVAGFRTTDPNGWADAVVLVPLALGVVLLLAFARWQARAAGPLLPTYLIRDRRRMGALVTLFVAVAGSLGFVSALAKYLHHASAMDGALSMLPMVIATVIGATQVSARLLHRWSPRALVAPGLLLVALGMTVLTSLGPDGLYSVAILSTMIVVGLGLGMALTPLFSLATDGVDARDTGGGAAVAGMAHHLGGVIGAALFGSVVSAAVTARLKAAAVPAGLPEDVADAVRDGASVTVSGLPPQLAAVISKATWEGYAAALWVSVGLTLLAALLAAVLLGPVGSSRPGPGGPARPAHDAQGAG
jgi:MFS family permease